MWTSWPTIVGAALICVGTAAGPLQAQRASGTRAWYPWIAASAAAGSIDVEEGSADFGPAMELAAGIVSRVGVGAGIRVLGWSRPNLISSGGWSGHTVVGFASYRIPGVSFLNLTGGVGASIVRRQDSGLATPDALTAHETVAETGLELNLPNESHVGLRAFALREWKLSASTSASQGPPASTLQQWYFGLGLRLR